MSTGALNLSTGAIVAHVEQDSPAYRAGLREGMKVLQADGQSMRDILDWYWIADGYEITLLVERDDLTDNVSNDVTNACKTRFEVTIERNFDGSWGFEFTDNLFDGVMTCKNSCTFCFMSMLPKGLRGSLYLRDDDYRLSFLQGNFVTLTNLEQTDIDRIIEMSISPLHVSIHALDVDVRKTLMGENHSFGLTALKQLLDGGIDLHLQAVLVPSINDGEVLEELLSWAIMNDHVLSIGLVPLGYTRYQNKFDHSYQDPQLAKEVLRIAEKYRLYSKEINGVAKVHPADEFYCNAYKEDLIANLPSTQDYDDFPQFYDGIGMLRLLVDGWHEIDWETLRTDFKQTHSNKSFAIVCGKALEPVLKELILSSNLQEIFYVVGVQNNFFGGNVDVSGLLTFSDVAGVLDHLLAQRAFFDEIILPNAMFNDDSLTLDNKTALDLERAIGLPVRVVCYEAKEIAEILC